MRQETTVTTYYEFSELTDKQKKKAIEKHREINVDYGWHDDILDEFTRALEILGFKKVNVSYRGFWYQGDGASFTGEFLIPEDDDTLEMRLEKFESEFPHLYARFNFDKYSKMTFDDDESLYLETYEIYRNKHFCGHSNTVFCDHDGVEEFTRSFSDFIYKTLEKQYEFLTSDEQVIETLIGNKIEFTTSEVGDE